MVDRIAAILYLPNRTHAYFYRWMIAGGELAFNTCLRTSVTVLVIAVLCIGIGDPRRIM